MKIVRLAVAGALVSVSACGYFNTMYNANRAFADAEKAANRGDLGAAETSYRASIEKALKRIIKSPDGRWSGDARLIVGRAQYALGEYAAAVSTLQDLLVRDSDPERRGTALIYLAVITDALGDRQAAFEQLNAALARHDLDPAARALGQITRGRILLDRQDYAAAAADLERASAAVGPLKVRAELLRVRVALAARDTAAAARYFANALGAPGSRRWLDSIRAVSFDAARTIGGIATRRFLDPGIAGWTGPGRDSLTVLRAELALMGGDTAGAVAEIERLSERTTRAAADQARVLAAEWTLSGIAEVEQLSAVRSKLIPAIGSDRARVLIQDIKTVEVLVETASRTAQPLALFAAAEVARDALGATRLASRLFTTYAEVAPKTVWAPKALLAALALEQGASAEALRRTLNSMPGNPYVSAVTGVADSIAYKDAEERLDRTLQVLRAAALSVALQLDNAMARAVVVIDSIRAAARNDSTRIACGILLDSLAFSGIRADSVRTACQRGDRERIALLIKIDTLLLRRDTIPLSRVFE